MTDKAVSEDVRGLRVGETGYEAEQGEKGVDRVGHAEGDNVVELKCS